jgi:hypothetical protein
MAPWGKSKALLAKFRQSWGHEISRERKMDAIALYHDFTCGDHKTVDEQTWQDLGMDEVFAAIDRTASLPGRQVLYARLRSEGAESNVLSERTRQYDIFRSDPAFREQAQLLLVTLDRPNTEFLAPLLLGQFPDAPRLAWLFYVLAALPTLCLVGMRAFHPLFLMAIAFGGINFAVYLTYGQRISPYFSGFARIETLLSAAERLCKIPDRYALPELQYLRGVLPQIRRLRKRLGWLVIDRASLPDLLQGLFAYLNVFFLFDILVFLRSRAALRTEQPVLAKIFEAVGSLDAAIAVASYLEGLPDHCVPNLVPERRLQVVDLRHPLIPMAVSNSLRLDDRSAVIAGPNMAGKTSFIRTVGINLILAQTLNVCLAKEATLPRATVRSAIRREDKLSDGQSYFFAEIKQVLDFIQLAQAGSLHVFLIDEIFRGTNTGERIACSVAVLRHLARSQMVLVTTHDSELQELLADSFDMHHFSDGVIAGKYGFDYLIRSGPAHSHNAIKLLEFSGYPSSITSEAEALAAQFALRHG